MPGHDLIRHYEFITQGSDVKPGWNLLMDDGHVIFVQNTDMVNFYTAGVTVGHNRTAYEQVMDILTDDR